jgi:hypothetical protein
VIRPRARLSISRLGNRHEARTSIVIPMPTTPVATILAAWRFAARACIIVVPDP